MKSFLPIMAFAIVATASAQNIKSEDVQYNYIKLPTNPLNPKPANYYSSVVSVADAENAKLKAKYEADKIQAENDYQRDLLDYSAKVKAADEQYAKDMEAWNAKSTAKKILERELLNENNKPVKPYVPQPSRRYVSEPKLVTAHDVSTLASTYLKIDGFDRVQGSEIMYLVEMGVFENSDPRVVSEIRKETRSANGTTSTYDVAYYHLEFNYRHPMTVKITKNGSQELYMNAPSQLNEFKTYKSAESKSSPSTDISILVKSIEAQILKENLEFINHMVNDRMGFEVSKRKSSLDYVKTKGEDYADVNEAYDAATMAFTMMGKTDDQAKAKLQEAVSKWAKALAESDPENKKARIDKNVTISLGFNLLEAYFALRMVDEAEALIASQKKLDLSKKETKLLDSYTQDFIDLRMRKTANNI